MTSKRIPAQSGAVFKPGTCKRKRERRNQSLPKNGSGKNRIQDEQNRGAQILRQPPILHHATGPITSQRSILNRKLLSF
jgi:hypothetical protein